MRLATALRLSDRDVVAFVGGGGKTTAMFRLASEIAGGGGRAVTTTTTRIFAAQTQLVPVHVQSVAEAKSALESSRHVLLTGPVDTAQGKAFGVTPDEIEHLRQLPKVSAVLVEADGSRMRPFKAPADHEPVIPPSATIVVVTVGIDIVGRPLTEKFAHRPELIARLAGAEIGAPITPAVVANVLGHAEGGLKNVPSRARVTALINKVEGSDNYAKAQELARLLLRSPEFNAVLIGAVANPQRPVAEYWARVGAVVLAAGEGRRMGRLKQLLPWRATTLVGHAADTALRSNAQEVIVVTGAEHERVREALQGRAARIVVNSNWRAGQSESVRVGLDNLPANAEAAVFLLADQPNVSTEVINALVERWRQTLAPIVAPRVEGRRANPVLFDRQTWAALREIQGDTGGRAIFEHYHDRLEWVDWDRSILGEADTPEEYESLRTPAAKIE